MTMSLLKIFFILIFSINGTVNINKQNIYDQYFFREIKIKNE